MAVTLYKKQKQVYDFICQYVQRNDFAPTLREIADAVGVNSVATIHEHLQSLEERNLIRRSKGKTRSLELVNRSVVRLSDSIDLPILGFIAAGSPIEPYTDPNATFKVSPEMISGKRRAFVLQVKGRSMIEDYIADGDYVVCEEYNDAEDGDIVVALLDNGLATLKRFYREPNRIRLQPSNSEMSPIYALNVTIQGKVVGLIRKFRD